MNQPGYTQVRTSGTATTMGAPIPLPTLGRPMTTIGGPTTTYVTGAPATQTYGLGGDPERRLNEASARQLARMVFLKYDDNDSGFMNSNEAANLITDLYASVNMEYRATPEEGKEFMKANDSDLNWQFNREDFEDFFVKHLSTQNNHQGFNLFGDSTRGLPTTYRQPVHAPGTVGHFHKDDPLNVVAGSRISGSPMPMGAPMGQPIYTAGPTVSGLPR